MAGITACIFGLVLLAGSIDASWIPKIVGGQNAVIKNYPYLVSLRILGKHFCGGSIISEKHILTAAHCMEDFTDNIITGYIKVHSGTSKMDKRGIVHEIEEAHTHPKYDKLDYRHFYDICILTLKKPITFTKYQKKIDLPKHDVEDYKVATTVGWGRTSWNGKSPDQLQKLRVVLLTSDKCEEFMDKELREDQVCVFRSVGTGPCHGDSGGPVVLNDEVVGIASYVKDGICGADSPSVYTNVFAYKDFISSIVNK